MELTISVRTLGALVNPVMACASNDQGLPVLNAVRIESHGKYLTAVATDRFRLAMKRQAAPADTVWPKWSATVPVSTIKSILATFKPSFRDADPLLTLTVNGDTSVRVTGEGALLDFDEAAITYPLSQGEFPKVAKLFREAIAAESTGSHVALNPALLAGVMPKGVPAAAVKVTSEAKPILITDGEDFISILMPRRLIGASLGYSTPFPSLKDWSDLLADEPAKAKTEAKAS